jgi:hypothetical protein
MGVVSRSMKSFFACSSEKANHRLMAYPKQKMFQPHLLLDESSGFAQHQGRRNREAAPGLYASMKL